jgi:anti-sigma regulatory factor (Ser/Thr protein kinase)
MTTATAELSLSYRPDASAPWRARRAVGEFCRLHGLVHLTCDAELLTSEVMTNAVRHGAQKVTLRAVEHHGVLFVIVTDDGGEFFVPPATFSADPVDRGRGLHVVDELAGDWGLDRLAETTVAWFRLS